MFLVRVATSSLFGCLTGEKGPVLMYRICLSLAPLTPKTQSPMGVPENPYRKEPDIPSLWRISLTVPRFTQTAPVCFCKSKSQPSQPPNPLRGLSLHGPCRSDPRSEYLFCRRHQQKSEAILPPKKRIEVLGHLGCHEVAVWCELKTDLCLSCAS